MFLIDVVAIIPFEALLKSSNASDFNGMIRVTKIGRL